MYGVATYLMDVHVAYTVPVHRMATTL